MTWCLPSTTCFSVSPSIFSAPGFQTSMRPSRSVPMTDCSVTAFQMLWMRRFAVFSRASLSTSSSCARDRLREQRLLLLARLVRRGQLDAHPVRDLVDHDGDDQVDDG